jgi:hypothetical protein
LSSAKLIKEKQEWQEMTFWKWLLFPAEFYTPELIRRMVVVRLATLSAGPLHCPGWRIQGRSAREMLENYARFTAAAVSRELSRNGDPCAIRNQLYQEAYQAGQAFRLRFGLAVRADVIRLMRFLYRVIRIDLQSDPHGSGILISQCFFSRYYSGEVCRVMSALDQGLAAGLSGGGHLEFGERITDGYPFCRAYWREPLREGHEKGD